LAVPAESLALPPPNPPQNPFKAWLAWVTFERALAPSTISGYKRELLALGPPSHLLSLSTEDLRRQLHSNPEDAISTRNGRIAAYRSFFKEARRQNWRQDDPSERLDRPKSKRGIPHPVPDLDAKLALLSPTYRNIAVIFVNTGMRLSEGCSVEVPIPVPRVITVIGKGSKERPIPLNAAARQAFTELGGKFPVGPRAIEHAFRKAGFHPHALRHHCASTLYAKGVRITTIQKLLGHSNLNTTMIYTLVDASEVEEAVELL
jgi:integrase/recombinase XerD